MRIILEAQMRSKVTYLADSPEDSCDGKGGEGKAGTRSEFRALLGTIGAPASWNLQTVEWDMPLNSLPAPQATEGPLAPRLQVFVNCPSTDCRQWGLEGE